MSIIRDRLLKNSGIKILNEDAGDKLKELEIKERAQRLISNFQREVLSLAQYIEKGCIYSYDREATPLSDEVCNEYKKLVGTFLTTKMSCLAAMIADSFGEESEEHKEHEHKDEDGDEEEHNEVSVVMTTPEPSEQPVVEKKHSMFPY